MNDEPNMVCVDCGSPALKTITTISVNLKTDDDYSKDVKKLEDAADESGEDLKELKNSFKGKVWK